MINPVRIGTRGSQLALWQAEFIASRLHANGLETQIVTFTTKGDTQLSKTLSGYGTQGIFTKELEIALKEGEIDIAVHSSKDVQSRLEDGYKLVAYAEREAVNDVLVSTHTDLDTNSELVIGTSSVRRRAFLSKYYPQFKFVNLRGNLQTRLKKHENGECDAMMLAKAGVDRMGMSDLIRFEFSQEEIVPPAGQGCVAIEMFLPEGDTYLSAQIHSACNDEKAEAEVKAERSFLATLDGGCSIPVFANARLNDQELQMVAGLISTDGKQLLRTEKTFNKTDWEASARQIAEETLSNGGADLLQEIKRNL